LDKTTWTKPDGIPTTDTCRKRASPAGSGVPTGVFFAPGAGEGFGVPGPGVAPVGSGVRVTLGSSGIFPSANCMLSTILVKIVLKVGQSFSNAAATTT
jgi:hypothetical protein